MKHNQNTVDSKKNVRYHEDGGSVRTCKLYIRNMDMPTQFFEVKVTETKAMSDGTLDSRVVDKLETRCPDRTCKFLIRHGVEAIAVAEADAIMMNSDHNCAHFGTNGGFIYSEYEGSLH